MSLFATVFFSRAWMIKIWGGPVPTLDEWDSFGLGLYRPWLEGTLTWADIFSPHNEHRIALTRLADLGLFILNGGWNPLAQLLLNAALHALTATVLLRLAWEWLTGIGRVQFTILLVVIFSSTSGWQNALWGFQSQFYFCQLLSVLALAGLLLAPVLSRRWWLACLATILTLFTTAGGVLAAITGLIVTAATIPTGRSGSAGPTLRTYGGALGVLAAIVCLGWLLRTEVAGHAGLQARDAGQFGAVFWRSLAWPWITQPVASVLLQSAWLGLGWQLVRTRRLPTPFERWLLALGLLAVLHAAAVAWSRGAGLVDGLPLSRYLDVQLLGVCANALILLRFIAQQGVPRIAGLLWTGLLLTGLLLLTTENLSLHLPFHRLQQQTGRAMILHYQATHDPAALRADIPALAPHPDPQRLRQVLDDPRLRPHLPDALVGSAMTVPWPVAYAPWWLVLSATALTLACLRCRRHASPP